MPKRRLFAAGAAFAIGAALLLGATAPAMASTINAAGPTETITPGNTGRLSTYFVNPYGSGAAALTSNLTITWTAPANAIFLDRILDYKTSVNNSPYPSSPTGSYPSGACTLSNGSKTLSCVIDATVPANATNWQSFLWLEPHIVVDPSAPLGTVFASSVTVTSNNGQISSGTTNPAYQTPAAVPVPVASTAAWGVAALAAASVGGWVLLRRKRTSATE